MASTTQTHWDDAYTRRAPDQMSWFEEVPRTSLTVIESLAGSHAGIIEIGGGASRLGWELVRRGYTDVTVADVSAKALDLAREEMGPEIGRSPLG